MYAVQIFLLITHCGTGHQTCLADGGASQRQCGAAPCRSWPHTHDHTAATSQSPPPSPALSEPGESSTHIL